MDFNLIVTALSYIRQQGHPRIRAILLILENYYKSASYSQNKIMKIDCLGDSKVEDCLGGLKDRFNY